MLRNSVLEGNLRALYRALKSETEEISKLPLKASRNSISFSKNSSSFFKPKNPPSEISQKLARAIQHTQELFHHALKEVETNCHQYKNYLIRSGKGYLVNESEILTSRRNITSWNQSTLPFVKLVHGKGCLKFESLLKKAFSKDLSTSSETVNSTDFKSLFAPPLSLEMTKMQKVIDLEGISAGPLPLAIFKKLIKLKPLPQSETKDLCKWIKKMNQSQIPPRHLHQALEYLGRLYGKEEQMSVSRLEFFLEELGATILSGEDQKHLKWLEQVKCGYRLNMKDRTLTFGNEIQLKGLDARKTRLYAIKEEPEKIAVISSINSIRLLLKDFQLKQTHYYGIKPALFLEFSEDGKTALMEKCEPLCNLKWTNCEGVTNTEETQILSKIAEFLSKLVKENETPKNFSLYTLMLDKNGELTAIEPQIKGDFDFTAIENFIFSLSSENETVFKYLIEKSGLKKHYIANFYEDLLQNILIKEGVLVEDLAAIHLITDPKVVDNAKSFVDQIAALKTSAYNKLFDARQYGDSKLMEEKVSDAIISLQKEYQCSGFLWPTLVKDILNKLTYQK